MTAQTGQEIAEVAEGLATNFARIAEHLAEIRTSVQSAIAQAEDSAPHERGIAAAVERLGDHNHQFTQLEGVFEQAAEILRKHAANLEATGEQTKQGLSE